MSKDNIPQSEIQHQIGALVVSQRVSDGYINATQLCKAYEQETGLKKTPAHWLETDRAKAYIRLKSTAIGKTVTEMVVIQRGNFSNFKQGTWLHPKLAVSFSSWLSVEFEVLVTDWVDDWLKTGVKPKVKNEPDKPSVQELEEMFNFVFGSHKDKLDPLLLANLKCKTLSASIPQLADASKTLRKDVSQMLQIEEALVSPTVLGEMVVEKHNLEEKISPVRVNIALQNTGLQVSKDRVSSQGKSKKFWELTPLGQEYGKVLIDTAQHTNKTVFPIRWSSDVITLIESQFVQSTN